MTNEIEAWLKETIETRINSESRRSKASELPQRHYDLRKLLALVRLYRKCCEVTGALIDTNVEGKAKEIVDG